MSQSKSRVSTQEAWRKDDDWSVVEKKEERKKLQNRLNQRAYRRRNTQKEPASGSRRPFQVERFRIMEASPPVVENKPAANVTTESVVARTDELKPAGSINLASTLAIRQSVAGGYADYREWHTGSQSSELLQVNPDNTEAIMYRLYKLTQMCSLSTQTPIDAQIPEEAPRILFPFSSDHLLHLIHYNVYRALITNKCILKTATVLTKQDYRVAQCSFYDLCDGLTIIHPKENDPLPPSLVPTPTQMTISHSSWLGMFPYPQLRDNLILHQDEFNHWEFCNDLWGEFYFRNLPGFASTYTETSLPSVEAQNNDGSEFVDDLTSGKQGLIVWGEPWDLSGWEVTEGFVNKWSWVLEGCIDLFVSSNFWRAKRDLGPLEYPFPRISEVTN